MAAKPNVPQNLVFDADDTLWHSEIHFREAFAEFTGVVGVADPALSSETIKQAVTAAELRLIVTDGYGRRPYVRALHEAIDVLCVNGKAAALHVEVDRIGTMLISRHCELLPDVAETLALLSRRHKLLIFTKGQRDEQMQKLARSGLEPYFTRVETPREKDVAAYRRLLLDADLAPDRTWMIGNSPRSDVNPAVRAGLRAVYIPYEHTWELDYEEINADDAIVTVGSFRSLLDLF